LEGGLRELLFNYSCRGRSISFSTVKFQAVDTLVLWATPWWVNLLLLVPFITYWGWRRKGLDISACQLGYAGLFAMGFGFVEAAVVVYLSAATGTLPGYGGSLTDVQRLAASSYEQARTVSQMPPSLLTVEVLREAATMLMLLTVALLAARRRRERWAMFLWCFAIWDIVYYAGLWATVRWPLSLKSPDVLFLIPVPWVSQVWFPILVSTLSILVVVLGVARKRATARVYE
jgi:Kef-type K+ transport system membrane component KefB